MNNDTSGVNTVCQFFNSSGTIENKYNDYHYSRLKIENMVLVMKLTMTMFMTLTATVGHNTGNRKGVGFEMVIILIVQHFHSTDGCGNFT